MITAILWMQTLLESDLEHYKKDDLNSWMFLRFDIITTLDTLFYFAYIYGGQYLSVVKDDRLGAMQIMEKGLKYFPESYRLYFSLGMHYFLEMNNNQKSIEFFNRARLFPEAPKELLTRIIARLKAEIGHLEVAYSIIYRAYRNEKDERIKKSLEQKLYSIKAEKDLNCLNDETTQKRCSLNDFYGLPYQYDENTNKYKTEKEWYPFRPYRLKN